MQALSCEESLETVDSNTVTGVISLTVDAVGDFDKTNERADRDASFDTSFISNETTVRETGDKTKEKKWIKWGFLKKEP